MRDSPHNAPAAPNRTIGPPWLPRHGLRLVLLGLFGLTLLRTAWLADDAAITLRTVLNLLHGYGAVFNPVERVQAYTHPLWFGLLSLASILTGNVFAAGFALPLLVSLAVLVLVGWRLPGAWTATESHHVAQPIAAAGMAALLLSKSFVDFSTSGLENPLTHLLIALAVLAIAPQRPAGRQRRDLALLTSALWLTRPDGVVLLVPLLCAVVLQHWREAGLRAVALALLPGTALALTWSGFSLCYYGFVVPNTAFAKLGTGSGLAERLAQGLAYLWRSTELDPLTPVLIGLGLVGGVVVGWRQRTGGLGPAPLLALGIALHVGFVVSSGGDFMAGRLLTPALTAAVALLLATYTELPLAPAGTTGLIARLLAVGCAVLGLLNLPATLLAGRDYRAPFLTPDGIADERGYWFDRTSLLQPAPQQFALPDWRGAPTHVKVRCTDLGFRGTQAGPTWHLLDPCGLADPLLARLPAPAHADKRVGHLHRDVPAGYAESVLQPQSAIVDPRLRKADDELRRITRGPLWDSERWRLIVQWNLRGGRLP